MGWCVIQYGPSFPNWTVRASRPCRHRCEQAEVGLTRVLQLLDDVDFRTLGETRAAGKEEQASGRGENPHEPLALPASSPLL